MDQMNKIAHVVTDAKQGQWRERLFLCKSGLRYLKSETQILVTSIATEKIRKKTWKCIIMM